MLIIFDIKFYIKKLLILKFYIYMTKLKLICYTLNV